MKLVAIGDMGVRVNPEELKQLSDLDGFINKIALGEFDPVIRNDKSDLVVEPDSLIEYLQGLKKPVKKYKNSVKTIQNFKPKESDELLEYKLVVSQLMEKIEKLKQTSDKYLTPDLDTENKTTVTVRIEGSLADVVNKLAQDADVAKTDVTNFLIAKALFGKEAKSVVDSIKEGVYDKLINEF